MTEWEIIYGLLETIRNNEINDDDRMTESFLRHVLYTHRAETIIKNEFEFAEDIFQVYQLGVSRKNDQFVSNTLPDIIYDKYRFGISLYSFGEYEVPVVSREEAINSQKSRFYKPPYIAYITNGIIYISANRAQIDKVPGNTGNLLAAMSKINPKIEISCILAKPIEGFGYDWKKTPFPFPVHKLNALKQSILRKEFGIMYEVKKDEVQNARADNIIYQDESKLYK